jgi:hypothetical protein
MPWVRSHRRRIGWFRTTHVRSHHRSRPGYPLLGIAVAVLVILLLIALF